MKRLASAALLGALWAGLAPAQTATAPAPAAATAPPAAGGAAPAGPAPAWLAPDQYLFASGEAAALSRATWAALVDYVTRAMAQPQRQGMVLSAGATLDAPSFVPCDNKPPAVVTDIDESAILNVGWQYDDVVAGGRRFDAARWRRWEATGAGKVAPTPGAVEAVSRLRALGVEVIFNSNRDESASDATVRALATAGLGRVEPGRTLFLRAAGNERGGKDARRQQIAADHCVLAMLGDQLGDFSDLFDTGQSPLQRRSATTLPAIADLWGEGWFLMPNPLYGTALRGQVDDIFPGGLRWTDPGAAAPPGPGSPAATPSVPTSSSPLK